MIKTLLATAAIAATVAVANTAPASADPNVQFSFGIGTPGYDGQDYWRQHHRRHWDNGGYGFGDGYGQGYGDGQGYGYGVTYAPRYAPADRLSCGGARDVVRAHGFNGVRPVDCSAPVYGFRAWKHGDMFRVSVSTSGRIVGVNPIY